MPSREWLVLLAGVSEPLAGVCHDRLGAARFVVREAASAEDARARCRELTPRAILVGKSLAEVDAASFVRHVRRRRSRPCLALAEARPDPCRDEMFDVCLPDAPPRTTVDTIHSLLRFAQMQDGGGQLLRRLLDAAPDAMLTVDAAGRILLVNAQVETVFGYRRQSLLGRTIELLLPASLGAQHADLRHGYLREPHARPMGHHGGLTARHQDGHEFPVEICLAPLDIDGEHFVTAAVRDVTERRRVERLAAMYAASQEANRVKDEFLATVSHELRTPLNVILGWAGMLQDPGLDPGVRQRAQAAVERNSKLMSELVSQLLDVSRIVSGKLHLDRQPLDVGGLVAAEVEAMRPAAEGKRISLLLRVQPGLEPVFADANRLRQVASNLLSNALKFTPAGGAVRVSVSRREAAIRVRVADTGIGIAASLLPFVFDRFRQGRAAKDSPRGGLGLGLSIVRDLVEAHGGTASVESRGEGAGATFIVDLPTFEPASR
jgi:PAS domain S-box-containing protein